MNLKFSLLLLGVIFSVTGGSKLLWGGSMAFDYFQEQQLRKKGTPVEGEIIKIDNSNLSINGVSQKNLVVRFLDTEKTFKYITPQSLRGKTEGSVVAAKYNPDDPHVFVLDNMSRETSIMIMLIFMGGAFFLVGLFILILSFQMHKKYKKILECGLQTEARILQIKRSFLRVNNQQLFNLEVEFLGQARWIKNVHPSLVKKIDAQEGATITVKYDSQNPDNFIICDSSEIRVPTSF